MKKFCSSKDMKINQKKLSKTHANMSFSKIFNKKNCMWVATWQLFAFSISLIPIAKANKY